ncbi:hypothetical protein D3C72_1212480 [compost metagenome]
MAIMGHDDQGAFELGQRFRQRFARFQIQVVGRFIEQQQVRTLPDDQRQHQTGFFPAGEALGVLADFIALEAETAEVIAQLLLHFLRCQTRHVLNRRFVCA